MLFGAKVKLDLGVSTKSRALELFLLIAFDKRNEKKEW